MIDESLDGRRKASAKRTFDELTYHKNFIDGLLTYIRTFDKAKVDQLTDLIKAEVPVAEIGALIEESLESSSKSAQTEEALRVLHLDGQSGPPNQRRRLETDNFSESPITPVTNSSFESHARRLEEQESVLAFLKNTSADKIVKIGENIDTTSPGSIYDLLLRYSKESERWDDADPTDASSSNVRQRKPWLALHGGGEFSTARNLSVPK